MGRQWKAQGGGLGFGAAEGCCCFPAYEPGGEGALVGWQKGQGVGQEGCRNPLQAARLDVRVLYVRHFGLAVQPGAGGTGTGGSESSGLGYRRPPYTVAG